GSVKPSNARRASSISPPHGALPATGTSAMQFVPQQAQASARPSLRRAAIASALAGAWISAIGLSGCGGGGGSSASATSAPGAIVEHPINNGSARFIVDPNHGGQASSVKITGLFWGRLVSVRDEDGNLQQKEMVVGEDIHSDNQDYRLDTNPITDETT